MGFVLKMSWHGPVQLRNSPEPCWASSSFIFIHSWSGKGELPMSRLRGHWVNWVEWCPCGPCCWQAQHSSLQLRRDHREQMCLKGNHSVCSLWPHFVLGWASLGRFPSWNMATMTRRMDGFGALWHPVLHFLSPLDTLVDLGRAEHGQGEGWDLLLGKELVLLSQLGLPPISLMKIIKATFADSPAFPTSAFWIISFWKEQ